MSDAPQARPRRRGAPVVERVLDLALEELARVGYHRWSVPEVAARAGLNKTSVYRRWPTKGALVADALARAMGHDVPLPDTGALRSDLLAFAGAAAAWAETPVGRGVTRTLLAEEADPEVRVLVASLAARPGPMPIFARARARGELPDDADVALAMTVFAGALLQRGLVEREALSSVFLERLVAFVLRGLGTRLPRDSEARPRTTG